MKRLLIICLLLLASLLLTSCTQIVPSGNYTLESGETLRGSLITMSGNVWLEEDSRVTGSVILLSGNLTVNGTIDGDILMTSGNIELGPEAIVQGDISMTSGNVIRNEGAQVNGVMDSSLPLRLGVSALGFLCALIVLPIVLTIALLALVLWLVRRSRYRARPVAE